MAKKNFGVFIRKSPGKRVAKKKFRRFSSILGVFYHVSRSEEKFSGPVPETLRASYADRADTGLAATTSRDDRWQTLGRAHTRLIECYR